MLVTITNDLIRSAVFVCRRVAVLMLCLLFCECSPSRDVMVFKIENIGAQLFKRTYDMNLGTAVCVAPI